MGLSLQIVGWVMAGGCNSNQINYRDLPQDYLPPTKWEEISSEWVDPGDWITVNVNDHGLSAYGPE